MFPDSAERSRNYPLQITSGNMHFSILNYTYDTNGLPWKKPFIINIIDSALILRDIATAKTTNPDVIIAFMHWGTEYERQPNREQKLLAELMRREGVHLVIGAHPHVIQPMEKHVATDGRCRQLTAWSLGNLVSNQPFENSDGGALLKVALKKDSAGVWVSWAGYSLVWVYKPVERGLPRHYILPVTQFEADTARLLPQYRRQIRTFAKNSRQLLNTYNKGISEYRFFQNIPVKRIEPIPPVPLVSTVNKKQLKQK
jgi:poly-gamma-glutamate synthesis protein (capsule biosynthesis protein)